MTPHERKIHMKTLMITTALALALGLSNGASAETINTTSLVKSSTLEIVSQTETSLIEINDFYQGDYLAGSKAAFGGLSQGDLYTGRGASEMTNLRWVTH